MYFIYLNSRYDLNISEKKWHVNQKKADDYQAALIEGRSGLEAVLKYEVTLGTPTAGR
jgi:hypothetical protein